ncbi:hypothetical protein BDP81DRAFT_1625 [Colletotrichum phormii]|uniref:Uncharacterized protein n=1 Tax=Colletotrichum phormii TaxID=359342 RepID=A0AAJ0A631_9PEZI|nr:uncharacterized protein BDP81DRAFT_1625 [Colletotrichum phormii]KAK1655270.1 hypothetical protein BDP81DRAFT_1625 [Colletotrichum phormii]
MVPRRAGSQQVLPTNAPRSQRGVNFAGLGISPWASCRASPIVRLHCASALYRGTVVSARMRVCGLQDTARRRFRHGHTGELRRPGQTYFRRRLSWTTHSTLSHLQLPQGAPSTTSQRTLRARQLTQARAALRFVILVGGAPSFRSASDEERFLLCSWSEVSLASSFFGSSAASAGSSVVAIVSADRSVAGSGAGVASRAGAVVVVVVSVAIVAARKQSLLFRDCSLFRPVA